MKTNILNQIYLISLIAALFVSLGCIGQQGEQVGPMQIENSSVPLGDAKTVNAQIVIGAGNLSLSGGAADLMNASFAYNLASWRPEVSYNVTDGVGNLKVSQPTSSSKSVSGDVIYDWDIILSSNVPIDLRTILGAGDGNLKLGGMLLTGLKAQLGAGNVTIDMSGIWQRDLNATIEAGIGDLIIIVPQYTGAIISVSQGLGTVEVGAGLRRQNDSYINNAYGQTAATLRIDVKSGIGDVRLIQST